MGDDKVQVHRMRLIVCGGRAFDEWLAGRRALDHLHEEIAVTQVVSGGCVGADRIGERWARERGIPVQRWMPDWESHGIAAGPIRNAIMVANADAVAAFPGGRGTADCVRKAKKAGLRVWQLK